MKNNMITVVLLVLVLLMGCAAKQGSQAQPQPGGVAPVPQPTGMAYDKGRAVFIITDPSAEMSAVSSVKVTVDSIRVHSATEGWVTVSSTPKTYDLLQLNAEGKQALLADVELKEGTYQQIRLDISNVIVTDAKGEHEAKLPSGELKVVGDLVVEANTTATATFDFVANESLHVTGKGEYVMAPVVKVETREDAEVEVKSESDVKVSGGNVKTNVRVSMDAYGYIKIGVGIPADAEVSIEGNKIRIGIGNGKPAKDETKAESNTSAETNTSAEANISIGIGVGAG